MMAREMHEMRIFICNTHARQFQTFRFVGIALFVGVCVGALLRSFILWGASCVRWNVMLHISAASD